MTRTTLDFAIYLLKRVHCAICCFCVQINFRCKPSFRDPGTRNVREVWKVWLNWISLYFPNVLCFSDIWTFACFKPCTVRHHWVHRRRQDGKCRQCGKVCYSLVQIWFLYLKSDCILLYWKYYNRGFIFPQGFQQKFFHNKDIVAISCSWCKQAVHGSSDLKVFM